MDMTMNGKKIDMWEGYLYDVDLVPPCPHQWIERMLLTSIYLECALCGEEKDVEN